MFSVEYRLIAKSSEPRDDRGVIAKGAIAMHLGPVGNHLADVVEGMRPSAVTRDLHTVPGSNTRIHLDAPGLDLFT